MTTRGDVAQTDARLSSSALNDHTTALRRQTPPPVLSCGGRTPGWEYEQTGPVKCCIDMN